MQENKTNFNANDKQIRSKRESNRQKKSMTMPFEQQIKKIKINKREKELTEKRELEAEKEDNRKERSECVSE